MDDLIAELKRNILEHLHIDEVSADQMDADAALFVEGLGLDSIDAVELVVMVERCYGIRLTEMETAKAAFRSVRTLGQFILEQRARTQDACRREAAS